MSWNDLSMADRAKYIKLGVKNGITSLDNIRDAYNSYAEGGIKSTIINKMLDYTIGDLPISTVRRRLYNKVLPVGYSHAYSRFKDAIHNETPDITDFDSLVSRSRDDIWAEYLQIPRSERHNINTYGNVTKVIDSNYTPTKNTQDISYKALDNHTIGRNVTSRGDTYYLKGSKSLAQRLIEDAFGKGAGFNDTDGANSNIDDRSKSSKKVLKIGENKISGVLDEYFANHTIGRGLDPKEGEYISYYDLWDLTPEGGHGKDQSNGIGKPVEFYDRIYLDDYYEIPREERNSYTDALYGGYLPELTVHSNKKSYGGKVHKYDGTSEATQQMNTTAENPSSHNNGMKNLIRTLVPFIDNVKPELNRLITDEQLVDSYINNVVYTMENPNNKGLRKDGNWKMYTDTDLQGNKHYNYGPGIEKNSDIGANLKYNNSTSYKTEELNKLLKSDLLSKAKDIRKDLHEMYGEDSDTLSLGNKMILLDIAHNVRPKGSKRKNMPKAWPNLTENMMKGNLKGIKNNTYSGSTRRSNMRNDLIWKDYIDKNTVKNY